MNEPPVNRTAYEKAVRMIESGQCDEGVALLEKLANNGSTCWEVYNDLAVQYFNQGDNLRAALHFQKGIALEGNAGTTARNFATMLAMTSDVKGTLAVLGRILHEQPHDEDVLAVIRDLLSDLNPIPPDAWLQLVSDLRRAQWTDQTAPPEEPRPRQHHAITDKCSNGTLEQFPNKKTWETASFCPVCSSESVSFHALSDFYIENARRYGFKHFENAETLSLKTYSCANCGASDRERLYALWIDQQIKNNCFFKGMSVIHFAPEAALSKKIKQYVFIDYKTADLLMDGVDYKVDMMNMPFDDASFDFFICSHVLEHVEDDDQAIRELYRITKPGGRGILVAPIIMGLEKTAEDPSVKDEANRWRLFGQNDHVRLYAHDDYVNKIRSHSFHVEELGENYFGEEIFRSLGLTRTSILYVVSK